MGRSTMDRVLLFAAFAAAILVAGLGALVLRQGSLLGGSSAQVAIVNSSFSPANLTVTAGTTVRWTNMDFVDHTVTFVGQGMGSTAGMGSGTMGHMAGFSYTFMRPGTYQYHCTPHPYMTGTVTVTS